VTVERPHSVSVAGVLLDARGRALLIQRRDNGHWEPPGGVLEPGETIPAALAREVHEETGLTLDPASSTLTGVYTNTTALVVALVFRCPAPHGTPATGPETRALHWATAAEVTRLATEAYAIRVLDAMTHPPATHPIPVRAHDGVRLL
jgi:8-oxo-dGTP pyrophosphatase MutT (NUDIX family)